MTDEKYVFVTDVRDKKRTARGAFNKRTHAGKGGAVKFPSDFLGKKELNAMNGDVRAYRLNDPMDWKEFKSMPDDLKISYVKALRQKFGVPDSKMAEMFGTSKDGISLMFKKLGLNGSSTRKRKGWDSDGFYKWVNGIRDFEEEPSDQIPASDNEQVCNVVCDMQQKETMADVAGIDIQTAVPSFGSLVFESNANAALKVIEQLLRDSYLRITVSWEQVSV